MVVRLNVRLAEADTYVSIKPSQINWIEDYTCGGVVVCRA